jgi:hypothetical protein
MVEKKHSPLTLERVKALEGIGFVWNVPTRIATKRIIVTWESRLNELANYSKIYGHCNVPQTYSENPKLGAWVSTQRKQYKLCVEGKQSPTTPFRIQELERLGFEWNSQRVAWDDIWNELADYYEIRGHCNVPYNYPANIKLGKWVGQQRHYYRCHLEGKKSPMTPFRIQELNRLGFEWDCFGAPWADRLSELAAFREIHGHCNVPLNYSHNGQCKLANWVVGQRTEYRAYGKGKRSFITLPRIEALEKMSFEWEPAIAGKNGTTMEPILNHDVTRALEESAAHGMISLSNLMNPTGKAKACTPPQPRSPRKDRS